MHFSTMLKKMKIFGAYLTSWEARNAAMKLTTRAPPTAKDFSRLFDSSNSVDVRKLLRDVEIVLIEKALERNAGNTSEAAKDLHLQRTTLIEKIKKYGL